MPTATHLARVADRSPLLVALAPRRANAEGTATSRSFLAVKVRPTLVHFLVDGRVWCVIRSKVPIVDVTDYGLSCDANASAAQHKLLVATVDGNVWLVTLPRQLNPGAGVVTSEVVLERSLSGSDGAVVQWFCQLPGVQSAQRISAGSGLTSLTLMRSVVTPSTLIVSTRASVKSKLQRHQSMELDDVEGEQSTCTLCLNSEDVRHGELLKGMFPDVASEVAVAAVLQGDLDGTVRFSLVRYPCGKGGVAKASVVRSGTLVRLDQPVQMIVPFSSSMSNRTALASFDALLVVGIQGEATLVQLRNGVLAGGLPVPLEKLEFGLPVQSLAFVSNLAVFVYCSSGLAFVCRVSDLAKTQDAGLESTINECAEKLPLQPGAVRLATHEKSGGLSFLFTSGRITTIDAAAVCAMVNSVLPLSAQVRTQGHQGQLSAGEPSNESRVRNLLQRIAQASGESTDLRSQSKQLDHQLKTLHSALEMLRVVEATGVESVVKCDLKASIVETGTFSDRKAVKLAYSLRFMSPGSIVSLDDWWLCLYVRTRQRAVTTYSFPLKDASTRGEQSIILDPATLTLQDEGCMWVSCSLLFCPSGNGHPASKQDEANPSDPNSFSFAVPLLQDRRVLFAQLSQPIEEDIPVSQVAINAAFRQDHVPFMPAGRAGNTNKDGKSSSAALWGGVQWWAAMADHAHKNPAFSMLWSKVAYPDAAPPVLSPPSRYVISIPSFFNEDEDDDEDEDEDFEKVRAERIVSFLHQLLEVPVDEVPRLRRSCRRQHGKLWTVLRSFSGSLILLRFSPSEDEQRSVELTIQCSDVADLSAMRALVLDTINDWSSEVDRGIAEEEGVGELALDLSEMLEPIAALETQLEELTLKTAKGIEDPQSAICTDEVLHALSQLAHLENQTLTLYWKSRLHLNRTIM